MKKLAVSIVLILVFSLGVSAQDEAESKVIQKGVKLGVGFYNIGGDGVEELFGDELSWGSKTGISAGAFFAYPLSPQFSVQPEVLYVAKGTDVSGGGESAKIKYSFIEIPILARYNIPTQGNLDPNLFAGPALSILTSAKISGSGDEADIKDLMKSTDITIVFGGGLTVQLESIGIVFDLRYSMGLSNTFDADKINKENEAEPGDSFYLDGDPDIKNHGISGHVGVSF